MLFFQQPKLNALLVQFLKNVLMLAVLPVARCKVALFVMNNVSLDVLVQMVK